MEQTLLNEIVARVAAKLAEEEGLTYIHPFNDLEVATGQGTIAYEIFQDLPDVDIILVPIGGGGLAAAALLALWRYDSVAKKQFGGITGDLAGWFLQRAELWMLAALAVSQWGGVL